jgi:hypothetical protein
MLAVINLPARLHQWWTHLWKKKQLLSADEALTMPVDSRATAPFTQPPEVAFQSPLAETGLSANQPTETSFQPIAPTIQEALDQYIQALRQNHNSKATIRNYKSDIHQFCIFAQETDLSAALTKPKLTAFAAAEAKRGLHTATIKRKLISLAQFAVWAKKGKLIADPKLLESLDHAEMTLPPEPVAAPKPAPVIRSTPALPSTPPQVRAPEPSVPVAAQVASKGPALNLKSPIPAVLSPAALNKWLPYFNLSVLVFFLFGLGFFAFRQFKQADPTLAYPTTLTRPDRMLSFQGRLTNTADTPVVGATNMRFRLYDDISAGNLLWDSNVCSIDPDQDGIFSTNLGAGAGAGSDDEECGAEISDSVFTENSNVWLAVTVGAETLTPRQPIRTVAYALNAETLQGYPASASAVENTVLIMDNAGEVVLGNTNPKIKATGTTFTLEGNSLTLQTTSGSNTDISLLSDQDIILDAGTNDLIVARDYLTGPGATLSATYAGGTALTLRAGPSATADILSWRNSGGTVLGRITSGGQIGVGNITPEQDLNVANNLQLGVTDGTRYIYFDNGTGNNAGIRYDSSTDEMQFSNDGTTWNSLGGSGAVNSVSNSDGTLVISPTTGNVVASLDLTNDNTWTGQQTFDNSITDFAQYLRHSGDTDTYLEFTTDKLDAAIGGKTVLSLDTNAVQDLITLGDGTDIDTQILADTSAIGLFVEGSSGAVGVGTNSPGAYALRVNGTAAPLTNLQDLGDASFRWDIFGGTSNFNNTLTVTSGGVAVTGNSTITGTLGSLTGVSSSGNIDLASLSAGGMVKAAATTGRLSIATGGTDYENPLTFNNGLTRSTNTVKLGGTLTANTDIPLGGFNLGFSGTGLVGIGTASPNGRFEIVGDTDDQQLIVKANGTQTSNLVEFQDSSGTPVGYVTGAGNINGATLLTGGTTRINGSGNLTSIGTTQFNTVTYTWPGSDGTNGYILSTNGTGTLSWADPSVLVATASYWDLLNGSVYLKNNTTDLLIGGNSTASAKFGFINVNNGTPTASISGTTANVATYLTGEGNLATTNMKSLTLGGVSTGNILLSPNNTAGLAVNNSGNVGIGTNSPTTKLHLADAGSVQLLINADTDDVTETDVPSILFRQDGATDKFRIGSEGVTGTAFTNSQNNTPYLASLGAFGLQFATNGTARMIIDSSGNVGIGTTSPGSYQLRVDGTIAPVTSLQDLGDATFRWDIFGGTSNFNNTLTVTSGGAAVTGNSTITGTLGSLTGLSSSGNIDFASLSAGGLVKAAPTTGRLSVATAGTDYENALTFSNGLTRTVDAVALGGALTGDTDIPLAGFNLALSGTGSLVIGDTTPTAGKELDVVGDIRASLTALAEGGSYVSFGTTDTTIGASAIGAGGALGYTSSTTALWSGAGLPLVMGENGSEFARFTTSTGRLGINTTTPGDKLEIYNANEIINRGHLKFTQEDAPGALTDTDSGNAGNPNGTYTYRVTFITANGETEGGTISGGATVTSEQIDLTDIPTGTTGVVTGRNIYRTTNGGSTYFRLGSSPTIADNTTTTFTDNVGDGSLSSATAPTSNTTAAGFFVGGSSRLSIDQLGRVGMGTTQPSDRLNVATDDDTYVNINATTGNSQIAGLKLQRGARLTDSYTDYDIYDSSGNLYIDSLLSNTTSTRFYIEDSTGFTGIGNTNPGLKLDVRGSSSSMTNLLALSNDDATTNSGTGFTIRGKDNASNWTDYGGISAIITDSTNSSEDGRILIKEMIAGTLTDVVTINAGNVGIGVTPGASNKLDVYNGATQLFYVDTSKYAYAKRWYDIDNTSYYLESAASGTSLTIAGDISMASGKSITGSGLTFGSAGVTVIGGASVNTSGNLSVNSGTGTVTTDKLTANTLDPPYWIDGKKYATYAPSMVGLKEEVAGVVKLTSSGTPGLYKYVIDFDTAAEGSEFWLFSRAVDLDAQMQNLAVLVSSDSDTKVFYKKDLARRQLIIFGTAPAEVSYRLTAPRFDHRLYPNAADNTDPHGLRPGTYVLNNVPTNASNVTDAELVAALNTGVDLTLNQLGEITITTDDNTQTATLHTGQNQLIERFSTWTQAKIGQLTAGFIQTHHLSADSIAAPIVTTTDLTAETIQTQEVTTTNLTATTASISGQTKLGSLVANTASVSGNLTASQVTTDLLTAQSASISSGRLTYLESKVAELDQANVTAFTAMTATISGTLYAENIADFDKKVADTFRQPSLLATLFQSSSAPDPGSLPGPTGISVASSAAQLRQTLAQLNPTDSDIIINPTALFVKQYFEVTGDSYLAGSVGIGSSLVIGDGLKLAGNELAYQPTQGGETVFKIQPSGLGKLELMAGRVIITDTGLVEINGDLRVAGAFTTAGSFEASGSAIFNQGLISKSDLEIHDSNNASVATISATGAITTSSDITAAGTGTFGNLKLGTEQLTATGSGTLTTSQPTGRAKLSAGQTEIILKSELMTAQTLVYVTPIGSTNNQVVYVKSQVAENPDTTGKEGEFRIGIDQAIGQDIEFTWWLVN